MNSTVARLAEDLKRRAAICAAPAIRRSPMIVSIVCGGLAVLSACSSRPTPGSITPPRSIPTELPPPSGAPNFETVLPGATPSWWTYQSRIGQGTEDGTVELCTLGQAMNRNLAYDLAIRNVRNAARVVLGEEPVRVYPLRAAASHALSGEYRVMVQARAETQSAEAARIQANLTRAAGAIETPPAIAPPAAAIPPPNASPFTAPATAPSASPYVSASALLNLSTPASPQPASPSPTPQPQVSPAGSAELVVAAPTWYTEMVARDSNRLTIGASAEGTSLRDARRQAVAAARAKLAAHIEAEPSDFQTPRLASQRLPDGRFRVYVLASALSGPAIDLGK